MILGKVHVPQELGVHPLKGFISLLLGFLDVVSVLLLRLIICGVVLILHHICTRVS